MGTSYQKNDTKSATYGGLPQWYSDGSRTNWARSKTTAAKWGYWNNEIKTYFIDLNHNINDNWQAHFTVNRTEHAADKSDYIFWGNPNKIPD